MKYVTVVTRRFAAYYRRGTLLRNTQWTNRQKCLNLFLEWQTTIQETSNQIRNCDFSTESIRKESTKIGAACVCWSVRRQYCTKYCNWSCRNIWDSDGSNVTRRRLYHARLDICKQMRSKITESSEFPEKLTFSYETVSHIIGKVNRQKLPNLGVGETSRSLTTWKRRPIIRCLVRDQEIVHYRTFLFWRRKRGSRVLQYNAARFPHSWISTVKSYRQNLFL